MCAILLQSTGHQGKLSALGAGAASASGQVGHQLMALSMPCAHGPDRKHQGRTGFTVPPTSLSHLSERVPRGSALVLSTNFVFSVGVVGPLSGSHGLWGLPWIRAAWKVPPLMFNLLFISLDDELLEVLELITLWALIHTVMNTVMVWL